MATATWPAIRSINARGIAEKGQQRQRQHDGARQGGCRHCDLAPLAEAFDQSDCRQLRELPEERRRGQDADEDRAGAQGQREPDENDPAREDGDEVPAGAVLHQGALASFDVGGTYDGIGSKMHWAAK